VVSATLTARSTALRPPVPQRVQPFQVIDPPSSTQDGASRYVLLVLQESLVADARAQGVERFVVGAVVHDHGTALLVTRSAHDGFLPNVDELPSGGLEPGESLAGALDRELLEEVGFAADPIDPGFLAWFDYQSGSGRVTRQFTVSVPLASRTVRLSSEHSAHRWIRHSELDATSATPETKSLLESWFRWAQA